MTDDAMTSNSNNYTNHPSITIRVEYRQLAAGPDAIEVCWEAGTDQPDVDGICRILTVALAGRQADRS